MQEEQVSSNGIHAWLVTFLRNWHVNVSHCSPLVRRRCLKKYCDCFSLGVTCNMTKCICKNCQNMGPRMSRSIAKDKSAPAANMLSEESARREVVNHGEKNAFALSLPAPRLVEKV